MPNTNPQAIRIANEKLRPAADKFGQLYNYAKMLQAEYTAENWVALFPNDAEAISDGSATDGRTQITNADVVAFMNGLGTLITTVEATSMLMRNNILKIAVNPERI